MAFFEDFGGTPDGPAGLGLPTGSQPGNTGVNGGNLPPVAGAPTSVQPAPGAAPAGPITLEQFNQAWMSSPFPGTPAGLKQFYESNPAYAAAGITLGGSKGDKVYGPGGTYWGDYIQSAGLGGIGKLAGGGPASGGGGTLGSLGYNFGASVAPWTENWRSPTAEEAMNAPGVRFGLEEANRMMQNSAAAKGTLLNGRVQQAIGASNVGNALQRYGDVRNWALGDYQQRQGDFYSNQDRPFQKFNTLATLGRPT